MAKRVHDDESYEKCLLPFPKKMILQHILCRSGNFCIDKTCKKFHSMDACDSGNLCMENQCTLIHPNDFERQQNMCKQDKRCENHDCIFSHTNRICDLGGNCWVKDCKDRHIAPLCGLKDECTNGNCRNQHPNEAFRHSIVCSTIDHYSNGKVKCRFNHKYPNHPGTCSQQNTCFNCETKDFLYAPAHAQFNVLPPRCLECPVPIIYTFWRELYDSKYHKLVAHKCYAYCSEKCEQCSRTMVDRKGTVQENMPMP